MTQFIVKVVLLLGVLLCAQQVAAASKKNFKESEQVHVQHKKIIPMVKDRPWMKDDLSPRERALLLLEQMTEDEKFTLIHGSPGPYVGNVPAIERLGIPALNLEDGPQGVADGVHNVTCWPSVMTVTATFDTQLIYQYSQAIALEQKKKGTNVLLAPMINLARVPQGGRNFESMGEDPYLAGEMAYQYVKGVQDVGVIACAKHWVQNNQEYNRTTTSADSSQRAFYELYIPHFKRTIDAGVGSFMCSYNKVNDTWACENEQALKIALKGRLVFEGWVMSDWGATHSSVQSANAGLDQEMPGQDYYGKQLQQDVKDGKVKIEVIDDSVLRILQSMFQVGLFDRANSGSLSADARSVAHTQLARIFAAQSIVLLKNENNILPLGRRQYNTIGIVGDAGNDKPVYAGFGSGGVIAETVVTPLQGIKAALAGSGTQILYAGTNDVAKVQEVVEKSDLVIVFIGTESSEGYDRPNLDIPPEQNRLVDLSLQLSQSGKVIVVLNVPGAIILPWIDKVNAVLAPFMGGQEGGNAIADVLFGDVNPSARLPITFSKNSVEIPPNKPIQYPGINNTCLYEEDLFIGYRWYQQYNIEPLFPFGFGLSYTSFRYDSATISGNTFELLVTVSVTNVGKREGNEVVQLYLEYPESLGEPKQQLRGFAKVNAVVGETVSAKMRLSTYNFQYWNTTLQEYQYEYGQYLLNIGASSNDIRLQYLCVFLLGRSPTCNKYSGTFLG